MQEEKFYWDTTILYIDKRNSWCRKKQNKEKARISQCSKQSFSSEAQQRVIYQQRQTSQTRLPGRQSRAHRQKKPNTKSWLILPISRWTGKHHTKNAGSSTRGSTSLPIHHTTNTKGPKRKYALGCLQVLGLVGNKLQCRDDAPHRHVSPRYEGGTWKSRSLNAEKSPHCHNSPQHISRSRWSRSPSPQHHNSPRHGGGSRWSISPWYTHDNENDEIEMGASCFTRKIRRTLVPKGSSYPMISRSTMGRKNHSRGYQIICK
jgi:hypothetical protein